MNVKVTCYSNGREALSFFLGIVDGATQAEAAKNIAEEIYEQKGKMRWHVQDEVTGDWLYVDISKYDAVRIGAAQ